MAFKPSLKRSKAQEVGEANMLPVMGLMCILIPLLLTSTESIKLGMIELNLPKASSGGGGNKPKDEPKEKEQKLNVNVTLTNDGFYVGSALGVATMEGEPTIPRKGGEKVYDYEKLTKYLADLKKKAQGNFVDLENITIVAEKDIAYKFMIWTMDAARLYRDDTGKRRILFPSVSIAAGVM
jgi:biopolymer transport protein ExbD